MHHTADVLKREVKDVTVISNGSELTGSCLCNQNTLPVGEDDIWAC
jgi:hypothetical protein